MKRMLPKGEVTLGLDTSHYDGVIDFKKVVELGKKKFCIQKCTEYKADSTFNRNRAAAKEAGLLFSGYHFFHAALKDPAAAAQMFLDVAHPEKGELRPMLDLEVMDKMPASTVKERAKIWLDIVEKATGAPPILYGGPYFLNDLRLDSSWAKYPLVVAHYTAMKQGGPLVPHPWEVVGWSFWQNTDKGDVPGIPAPDEDLDFFNGSYQQLVDQLVLK